jgi:ferredoxin
MYEIQTKNHIKSPVTQQTLHILPPHLQAGGECRRSQMPPLLPLQQQADKTRVHMETDGSGTVDGVTGVPTINVMLCSGCGRCVAACPVKMITLETVRFHKNAVIMYPGYCSACGRCVQACPVAALL